jgi:hypothetical protein
MKTLLHSSKLIFEKFPKAIQLPVKPAISPCVSLVGIPNFIETIANIITLIIALSNDIIPSFPFSKFIIVAIFIAIEKFIKHITIIPIKLKIALIYADFLKEITFVPTNVLIAFGASVIAFVKINKIIIIPVKYIKLNSLNLSI